LKLNANAQCAYTSFENSAQETTMDSPLAKTIEGLSVIAKVNPDLIVVHGDRETLALLGSLNNILSSIEGGELSNSICLPCFLNPQQHSFLSTTTLLGA
jgi:UDP-N-acetylglucosamine 2-epimerase